MNKKTDHAPSNFDLIEDAKLRKEEKMGEDKQVATREPQQEVTIFKADKALERVDEVIKFIDGLRARLKEGEDYAKHSGYQKPALEKPGAEKVCAALNCGAEIIKQTSNVISQQYNLKEYELVVGLKHRLSDRIVGEGVGYGKADEKDLYAYDKEANKRILKPERAEWANNTALKMAFKSALICATLSAGALSGYFTQDLEEIKNEKQTKKSQSQPQKPQGDLSDVLQFGKYKGLSLEQIHTKNSSYLAWLLEKSDMFKNNKNSELREKIEQFLDLKRLENAGFNE